MSYPVVIYNEEHNINDEFGPADAQKLRNCCALVHTQLESREMDEPDNTDPVRIPLILIEYTVADYKAAMDYLKRKNFAPEEYGKCISAEMTKNVQDSEDANLVGAETGFEGMKSVRSLLKCASYLQITSLMTLCYLKVASCIYIDTNESGAVDKVKQAFNIDGNYTIETETNLKTKYPFLNE